MYRESPVPVTEKWRGVFEEFQTALVVYGALVIRRRAAPGAHPAWTERRKMPADAASYLGWFRWRDRFSEPEERQKLLAATPRLAPDLKLTVTHKVENGGLVPAAFRPSATVARPGAIHRAAGVSHRAGLRGG